MLSGREAELAARLRDAAAAGQTQIVLKLLEDGAPFVIDSDGQTALHQAAAGGHADTVAALILGGCDASVQDFTGHTALQRAAAEGHLEIVKQLVKQGASVDHQDEVHGNTALHEAAWKGFSQTVGVLCRNRANFYIKNRGGFAPLHLCCQNGHNETCRVILLAGCKPDIKNNYGDTPLHTSARYGHAGVIRILVSAKCNASEQNKNGDTALHIAAAMGRRKLTRILLESGCDRDAKNKQGETALDIARRKNLADIVHILENPPPILSQADRETQAEQLRDRGHSKGDKKREKGSNSSKENEAERGGANKREKKRSRPSKERKGEGEGDWPDWSPYGCHYQPDPEEFPIPRIDTIPDDPLRAGEQYFLDLAGNIKKGPTGKSYSCYCGPAFHKFEKKLERDKRDLMRHIDTSHSRLDTKISHLERRTKDQLFNLNQTMKESFAVERSECLDRMDRRALRERIAIERQQAVRDISLKRDLASWLDKKLREIETKHGADARNAALLRSLAVRTTAHAHNGRRSTAGSKMSGLLSELENGGTLRRAVSEELLSEVGGDMSPSLLADSAAASAGHPTEAVYKGLKVSDRPCMGGPQADAPSSATGRRVRRNSDGDDPDLQQRHTYRPYQLLPPGAHHLLDLGPSSPTMAGLYPNEEDYGPLPDGVGGVHHLAYSTNSESCQDTTTSLSERGSVASSRDSHHLDPGVAASALGGGRNNAMSELRQPSQAQDKTAASSVSSSIECLPVKRGGVATSFRDPPREAVARGPMHPPTRGAGVVSNPRTRPVGGGLIRPIPMCYSANASTDQLLLQLGESLQPPPPHESSRAPPLKPNSAAGDSTDMFKPPVSSLRRFSTEADIHHATPLVLDEPEEAANVSFLPPEPAYLPPPYRSPPPSAGFGSVPPPPPHLYRLPRQTGPLLPPVDEDDYVPQEEKEQDLHRQLLNLPLHSDGGSHDSHNDSGYSTRLGASAGPSPSLSGSRPGSTDGDGFPLSAGHPLPDHPGAHHMQRHPLPPPRQYMAAHQEMGLPVAPRIRALQNKLKLTEASDAQGSLV